MFYHQSISRLIRSLTFLRRTPWARESRKALPETGKKLNLIIYLTEHQRQRHNHVRVVRVDSFREQLQQVEHLRVFALEAVW